MLSGKDISIDKDGSIILNGDKYPLASQAEIEDVKDDVSALETVTDGLTNTIGDITQTGIAGVDVAAQLAELLSVIGNKIKKLPTETTRYNFTAANTFEYTGVNKTCPAGHTYIIMVRLAFSNSEPKGILASTSDVNMRLYDTLARDETTNTITFMLTEGTTAHIWAKGAQVAGDDIRVDIVDITN